MSAAQVLEALAGLSDPREAWETLAARGLLPMHWVEDPRRYFVCTAEEWLELGGPASPSGGPLASPCPPTVRACAAFARDLERVLTAEALAREALGGEEARAREVLYWRVAEEEESAVLRSHAGLAGHPAQERLASLGCHLDPAEEVVLLLVLEG